MQPKLINFIKFDSRVSKSCQEYTKRYSIQPNTVRMKESIYFMHWVLMYNMGTHCSTLMH